MDGATNLTGPFIGGGQSAPVTIAYNMGSNNWVVGRVEGLYLKMVQIQVTGPSTFVWQSTYYKNITSVPASCLEQATFTSTCNAGTSGDVNTYGVSLTAECATPAPTPAPQQSYFEVTLPFNVTTASGSLSQFNESAFEQSVKTFLVQQVGITNTATWTQTAVNTTEYPVIRAVSRSTSNFTATSIAESFRQNQATAPTQLAAAGVTTTSCRDCFAEIHYIYVSPPVSHHSLLIER
jgi:hypothetical protein